MDEPPVVVGAAIVREGRVLAARRAHPPALAGRWELPGGAVEPGEDEPGALARECREELALPVQVGEQVGHDVALPGGRVLRVRHATCGEAEPVAREHGALRWVGPDELAGLDWLDTDRELLAPLRALLLASGPAKGPATGPAALRPPGRA